MRAGPVITDPVLYYKLDLGEPGIATPARASESTLRVTSHELENLARFKSEALREGGYVVYSNISLNRQFKGSFLATVSGRTEATIVKPKSEEKLDVNGNTKNSALYNVTNTSDNSTNTKDSIDKVEDKANDVEREVQRKLAQIERKLEQKENLPDDEEEKEKLRSSKARMKRVMNLVRLKKMQARQKKLLQNIQKNLSLAYKLAVIPHTNGKNNTGKISFPSSFNAISSESEILAQLQAILNSISGIDSYA